MNKYNRFLMQNFKASMSIFYNNLNSTRNNQNFIAKWTPSCSTEHKTYIYKRNTGLVDGVSAAWYVLKRIWRNHFAHVKSINKQVFCSFLKPQGNYWHHDFSPSPWKLKHFPSGLEYYMSSREVKKLDAAFQY